MPYLFTSESVSEGHPDKVSDQISDALIDYFLAYDANSKVACETLVTTGQVVLAGEVKSEAYLDVQDIAREVIRNIGYTKSAYTRIENYVRDIRLDIVEFSKLEDYHFNWYICEACYNSEKPRMSEVYWSEPNLLEFNGLFQLIEIGTCDYCGTPHIRCQGCGMVIEIDELEFTNCMCGLSFAVEPNRPGDEPNRPGDDPSDVKVVIKEIEENYSEENFVDPNQLDLFDQK